MRPAGWHFLPTGHERPTRDSLLAAAETGPAALARELRVARTLLGAARAGTLLKAAEAEAGRRFGRPLSILLGTTQQPRSLADPLTLGFAIAGFALTVHSLEGVADIWAAAAVPPPDGANAASLDDVRMSLLSMPEEGASPARATGLAELAERLAERTLAPVAVARFRLAASPVEVLVTGADVVALDIPVKAILDHRFAATFGAILTPEAADRLADAAAGLAARLEGSAPKLLITDLDDTLWQGVLGERRGRAKGFPALNLSYAEALATLRARGLVLAIASRSDPDDVDAALVRAVPLGRDDFAARAVGWADKPSLVAEVLASLGLAPQHAVFIDDDPVNCAAVAARFPEMDVRLFGDDPDAFAAALLADPLLATFDAAFVSAEGERAAQYQRRAAVERLRDTTSDDTAFLRSLETRVTLVPLDAGLRPRAAELASRVNQFLFTAYRPNGPELRARTAALDFMARLDDAFGAHGLVGLVLASVRGEDAVLDNLFLSCRALQRGVEGAMLHGLATRARQAGLRHIIADVEPLPRNEPARGTLARYGFAKTGGCWVYELGLAAGMLDVVPEGIDLIVAPGVPS